jgi:tetratricopeptide (TPR) repeat protein
MANELTAASNPNPTLPAKQVYMMAAIFLFVGLAIGYLFREAQLPASPVKLSAVAGTQAAAANTVTSGKIKGIQPPPQVVGQSAQPAASGAPSSPHAGAMGSAGRMPSMAEMKQMAVKQAAPLLAKLKNNPNDTAVLVQVAAVYHTTYQFKEAATYYGKAVQLDPKNVATRTKLASSLYRSGDADGAMAQLNQALTYDPKDANALFDLGIIRVQAKHDAKGAVVAWQQLLRANPQLSPDRKEAVEKLIAAVQASLNGQHGIGGAHGIDANKPNSK